MQSHETVTVLGQPSWPLDSEDVEAFITVQGGHLGPVIFDRKDRRIQPYAIAPWAEESVEPSIPPVLQVLRGDFFCLPFGSNDEPFEGITDLPHGETANATWSFESCTEEGGATTLHLSLRPTLRPGRVDKFVTLVDGHNAVYTRHVVSGMSGPMCLGHHAMLRFPGDSGSGRISTSRFRYGQVAPEPLELPEEGGRSLLRPGAVLLSLEVVPTVAGDITDLSRYPARRGSEDLVMLVSDPNQALAWTAVTFSEEGYVWFALKNPRVLRQTILWLSNGGRPYSPWNGRHIGVMGLEEVTAYFHYGLKPSTEPNPISKMGDPTTLSLSPDAPLEINYITGIALVPSGFERVSEIRVHGEENAVTLFSPDGLQATLPLYHRFATQ